MVVGGRKKKGERRIPLREVSRVCGRRILRKVLWYNKLSIKTSSKANRERQRGRYDNWKLLTLLMQSVICSSNVLLLIFLYYPLSTYFLPIELLDAQMDAEFFLVILQL